MSTDLHGPPLFAECPRCDKGVSICVCDEIRPQKTKLHVLLLQHPQEPDKELGSARIAHLSLPRSSLRVGLSWPNLRAALGPDAAALGDIQPSRWAVLYLGSGVKPAPEKTAPPKSKPASPRLVFVDRRSVPVADQHPPLDGIVVLDGSWSQAKTLWWRNAWLLKLRRAVLLPARPSLYGELRREPRRECLSTIESVAEALEALGEPAATGDALRALFSRLLDRAHRRSPLPA